MTQTLFIDKASGTFADPLLAYGLAIVVGDVLERTTGPGGTSVRLSDQGSYYCLECPAVLDDVRLATVKTPYLPAQTIQLSFSYLTNPNIRGRPGSGKFTTMCLSINPGAMRSN